MNLYDQACHGWQPGEPTLVERFPCATGLVLAFPWLAVAILAVGQVAR